MVPASYTFPNPRTCGLNGPEVQALSVGAFPLNDLICPFFAAMLNSGVLEKKPIYTRAELFSFTIDAGISVGIGELHSQGNFGNIPTNLIDLFDMEGNPNEHQTSTGVLDCPTTFPAEVGAFAANCFPNALLANNKCAPVIGSGCINGDAARERRAFDLLFSTADTNRDGILTPQELMAVEPQYNTTAG